MIWALAAFFGNIIEQLMITSVIREMNPIIYVALFYLFSTIFLVLFHAVSKKHEQFFDWKKARQHKLWAMGFAGGAFIGNALWFLSVYLMGLGITGFLLVFIRVLVTVYAYVYMKDRFPLDKASAFSMGVVMLLCFSLSDGGGNVLGITAALLSCFGFAMEAISRKKLVEYEVRAENMMLFRSVVLLVLSWSAVAAAVLFNVVEARDIVTMDLQSFLLIIGAALLGGLGVNMFVFYAMKTVRLSQYQALETAKPVFLALAGVLVLGEEISLLQAFYGGAIVLSAIYFLWPFKAKRPVKPNIP